MPSTARPPRLSATLVLLRDSPAGPEVLLLRRDDRGDRSGGAWVFPGGVLDAADRQARPHCAGLDDAAASARLGLAEGGLDLYVAAVRECFEECGVLLAESAPGESVDVALVDRLQPRRASLAAGDGSLAALCAEAGLRLAVDRLAYLSHWVTPLGYGKRFDARFFVAAAPAHQPVRPDNTEVMEHRWLRPADALAAGAGLKLMNPTRRSLEAVGRHADVASMLAWTASLHDIPCIRPHVGVDANGLRPVNPDEPAWAELQRLDPLGTAPARCDIVPGLAVRLSGRVIRVTAPNAGMMTGPGTNAYLVGPGAAPAAPQDEAWAVIDPGPDDPAHRAAILAAAPGPIRWILATHTHLDHSPGTVALREATGAEVLGRRPEHAAGQDATFRPDRELVDGERLALGTGTTLRVLRTPGHAANHVCFLLEEERTLFTGDHVMQGSTVVINPPDGDMSAYLRSLRGLLETEAPELDWLAPGHGFLIAEPARAIDALIAHRLRREAKVLQALRARPGLTVDALLPAVYDDVAPALHRPALRSLLAHLGKLRDDAAAREDAGRWYPAG